MKLQELPTDKHTLILCNKQEYPQVQGILNGGGFKPYLLSYRNAEQCAISIDASARDYTDVNDHESTDTEEYDNDLRLTASDFISSNTPNK